MVRVIKRYDMSRGPEKRSRWGCLNCRKRRKKCDEAQPACQICIDRHSECIYPDWSMVKYGRTRERVREYQDAGNLNNSMSHRPVLLPAQPSGTETKFVYHFSNIVAHLISFSFPQPDISNPFLLHILPRTSCSTQVQRAVEAVAAAHLYHLGAETQNRATYLHSQALTLLATELSSPRIDPAARINLLASSLLLIYYEIVLGNSANNAWCHLQGAKVFLEYQDEAAESSEIQFFRKIFQYFNVMLALSLGRQPLVVNGVPGPEIPDRIDTVFGCAGRLWPLMHRLADLIGRIRLGQNGISEARSLIQSLEAWSIESSPGPSTDAYMEAMLQIARAYKFCGILMLRMTLSSSLDSASDQELLEMQDEEVYRSAFDSVLRVCVLSTPMSTLTWPLYIVGRLAGSTSDRTVVMHIFSQFLEKHHMKVVDGARMAVWAYWGERMSQRQNWKSLPPVLLG
ncbi:hypothetical protein PENSTE_c019G09560 [Penicillium steckii]|uniref:Zn(2)-C6 fungal-type domain-containing protein n=1 Tax=Penicillium steckii TaxID=303698 RepID=A0A1V6SWB9_9EURO|nr:hypothetical protein PENSTE_c019G09560 [Penicillium steckii]